ncbi:type II toxin-antitoxin system HicA family toxin [Candidatus Uhrbacteria bacterium]|nr:type II toxin-antitoxin system HicA family toxin [Candidatus Uhrbacteria bacterium]
MSILPLVAPRRIVRALERAGFYVHDQHGSHCTMKRDIDSRRVTIAIHPRTINKGLLVSILNQAGLTVEEFRNLL